MRMIPALLRPLLPAAVAACASAADSINAALLTGDRGRGKIDCGH